MKKAKVFLILLLFLMTTQVWILNGGQDREISGTITCNEDLEGPVFVRLYKNKVSTDNTVKRLRKSEIYGDLKPYQVIKLEKPGFYCFSSLMPGYYTVLSFMDANNDGELSFNTPEPLGWFASEPGGIYAAISLLESSKKNADFCLRRPTHFPRKEKKIDNGALRWMKGLPVLQLWGTAEERGYAHGYLVGRQIIDFFESYIIEDSWKSAKQYQKIFVPFLENNFNFPEKFLKECDSVIKGMKDSGIKMHIDSLGRDFNRTDLLAINSYIEKRASRPVEKTLSCTQFAFWGDQTKGGSLKGGLIAARNMDGEIDIRKVTVSHFLIFAVNPSELGHKRWVSAMWPGFVGTISGMNEDGLYSMENAGSNRPAPVIGGIVPASWIQRYILEKEGANATPESILRIIQSFSCEGGGSTSAGSIILWAVPYNGQEFPAFVYEGDRSGGVMRTPTEVRPTSPDNIMASNHSLVYGHSPEQPRFSFRKSVSLSSLWRYEAGMNMLEAWGRVGRALGVHEAIRLLQTVSHATTEYSVIFLANEKRILVAVDDLKTDLWDAPYMPWKEFNFFDFFKQE